MNRNSRDNHYLMEKPPLEEEEEEEALRGSGLSLVLYMRKVIRFREREREVKRREEKGKGGVGVMCCVFSRSFALVVSRTEKKKVAKEGGGGRGVLGSVCFVSDTRTRMILGSASIPCPNEFIKR